MPQRALEGNIQILIRKLWGYFLHQFIAQTINSEGGLVFTNKKYYQELLSIEIFTLENEKILDMLKFQ